MDNLKSFIQKNLQKHSKITTRKLYGLNAFYQGEKPFILITNDLVIAIFIQNDELKSKYSSNRPLLINDKLMPNWYLIPTTHNKKKNKLSPIFDEVLLYLNRPTSKKKKKKKIQKVNKQVSNEQVEKVVVTKESLFNKIINIFTK